ncbi:N-(5'-phosphoribosyl)anthranilate isomerase [bacterium]|nr:N-(5'-phosphoribosyl)anthranilate isomerase [bacterium]
MTIVKICGIRDEEVIGWAAQAGADRIGLVVVPGSPRTVSLERAAALARQARSLGLEVWVVAAWDAADELSPFSRGLLELAATDDVSVVQLHRRERPEDIAAFRRRAPGVRIVKALGVSSAKDLSQLGDHRDADAFLFDAKPPVGSDREGGHGVAFESGFLKDAQIGKPWVLSGGLTAVTVAAAVRASGAKEVDVSSGVEAAPGLKDPLKIRAFVQAAKDV